MSGIDTRLNIYADVCIFIHMTPIRTRATADKQYLFGRTRSRSRWWIGVSIILFVLSYSFWYYIRVSSIPYDVDISPIVIVEIGFVLAFISAVFHAYSNDGLFISWLLVFFPVAGATLDRIGVGMISPTPLETVGFGIGIAAVIAFVFGTVGFLLGVGVRRLSDRILG